MPRNKTTGRTLVIGALGQIGRELVEALCHQIGAENVIGADIRHPEIPFESRFIYLDILDRKALYEVIENNQVDVIYNLAAVLSAKGEQNPMFAWKLNMEGLINTLEAARNTRLQRIFWPSSIAVFGPNSPKKNTPQYCTMDPNTVYGISKLAGERWCEYYCEKYGVDVRSIRYPGLIGYKSLPGGGTTDYAVDIFHQALAKGTYTSFLHPETRLPMMYMPDAIRATLSLMNAPGEHLSIRSSYNLGGISFSPDELASEIRKHIPGFTCTFAPDFRQAIADSWPDSINDDPAINDWGWRPDYDLSGMTVDMISHLRVRVGNSTSSTV